MDDDTSPPLIRTTNEETIPRVHKPEDFCLSTNPFGPSTTVSLLSKGNHATLGLNLVTHLENKRITLKSCAPSTPAVRIPRWRSTLRDALLIALGGIPVEHIKDVHNTVSSGIKSTSKTLEFTFVPTEHVNIRPDDNVPQIHFDQMNVMAHQHQAARNDTSA